MRRPGSGTSAGWDERSEPVACADPPLFPETADPRAYVPREATEVALDRLERAVARGVDASVLIGPPGIGKTLLIRRVASRLPSRTRAVQLAYGALSLVDLCAWSLGLLDEPRAEDPVERLQDVARSLAPGGGGLLLVVDDANSLSIDTARALGDCVRATTGALRLLLASTDDARTSRVVAALGLGVVDHRLDRPMTLEETQHYVAERLRQADADSAAWRTLSPDCVRRLHALSGGIPQRLHALATEVLRGEAGRRVLARLESDWLDRPAGLGDDQYALEDALNVDADALEMDELDEPDETHDSEPEPISEPAPATDPKSEPKSEPISESKSEPDPEPASTDPAGDATPSDDPARESIDADAWTHGLPQQSGGPPSREIPETHAGAAPHTPLSPEAPEEAAQTPSPAAPAGPPGTHATPGPGRRRRLGARHRQRR